VGGENVEVAAHDLTIQPGAPYSTSGGTGNGVILISANATEPDTQVTTFLKQVKIVQPLLKETFDFLNNPETEEVEKDTNGGDILTEVSEIRFCRWREAFAAGFFKSQFHQTDRDRFYVKVDVAAPNITRAKLKAVGLTGAVIGGGYVPKTEDGFIEVAMHQQYGITISDPIILVSDGDDDKMFNGAGQDDGLNDATLHAAFGSTISVEFPELGGGKSEFKAMKPKGKVTLNMVYCALPSGLVGGQIPEEMRDQIRLQAIKAKEAYRQIGIDVAIAAIQPLVLPTHQEAIDQGAPNQPNFPAYLQDGKLINLETRDFFNYLLWRMNGSDVPQEIKLQIPQDQILVAFIDARLWSPAIIGSQSVNGFGVDYNPVTVVSLESQSSFFHFVTAHEVGHIVTKWDHPEYNPPERLMIDGLDKRYERDHKDSKRFSWEEIKRILTLKHYYAPTP
jgi:hypothetical protein